MEPFHKESGIVTRPEVVEGIIQLLGDMKMYIVEGAAIFDTMRCFRKADYHYLEKKYRVKILDLHKYQFIKRPHLSVIDATTGMFGSHLYGRLKTFHATIVSEEPVACYVFDARFLGYRNVFYLDLALKRGIGGSPVVSEKIVK